MDAIHLLGDTKRRLLERLRQGPSTAQALSEDFGVQVSAVRSHLDGMEAQGLVRARFQRAGVGRPRKVYELTSAGHELFPRRYHELLSRLIAHLVAKEGRPYVDRLLADLARDLAAEMKVPTHGSAEDRARAAAQALSAMGFEATVEPTEAGGLALVRRNCVFMDAARDHHELVCDRFDQELVKAALGSEAALSSCMATGGATCRNVLVVGPGSGHGDTADDAADDAAGDAAGGVADDVAHDMAGESTGDMAGKLADHTKGRRSPS